MARPRLCDHVRIMGRCAISLRVPTTRCRTNNGHRTGGYEQLIIAGWVPMTYQRLPVVVPVRRVSEWPASTPTAHLRLGSGCDRAQPRGGRGGGGPGLAPTLART